MWRLTKEELQRLRDENQCIREEEQFLFLDVLDDCDGCAQPRELRRRTTREQSRARQACKRNGFATYDGGYWRMTGAAWAAHAQQLEFRNARR